MSTIIEFNNICEKYRIKFINENRVYWEEIWALFDINLKVEKGEVLGVIGENGAGKTTLLKLIAGMVVPDKGSVNVLGKVSALMELGAGFNPEFTGRENVMLNARMYGLDENLMQQKIEEIIEFSSIGKFIDAPVRYYSQGMYMRLAFALAIFVEPDILLIDDILAVGDEEAKQKCVKKVFELKESGKTIIMVSHDLDMVSKLCNRVIILNKGRIVKENIPSKVIAYYLEKVGDKRGLAVLEDEYFRVVFNNGKILFSYKDNIITKKDSCYASCFLSSLNSWLSSFNYTWEIKNLTNEEIIAEGYAIDHSIAQTWKIYFKGNQIKLNINALDKTVSIINFILSLNSQYDKWITLNDEGVFPQYFQKTNWQDLRINEFSHGFVGIDTNAESEDFPRFILITGDNLIRLFNSGYQDDCRIIQINSCKDNCVNLDIGLFYEKKEFKCFIDKERKCFLEKQKDKIGIISSGDVRLSADSEKKVIKLYYKDKEVTKNEGLHAAFLIDKTWHDNNSAEWDIKSVSEKEMSITLKHENIIEIWSLVYREKNILEIKIEFENDKPLLMNNKDVILELNDEYEKWHTAYEEGEFVVYQYVNDIGPIRLKDNRISKIILASNNNQDSLNLYFEAGNNQSKQILGILKKKNLESEEEFISLRFSQNIAKNERLISPGRHIYFEGKIILDKEDTKLEEKISHDIAEFDKGDLRFTFDRGKGRLFWKGKELTSGLGVYTSLRSLGIWHDSSKADWKINQNDKNKIIVSGDWPQVPVSQIWQIELVKQDLISWNVDIEIHEKTTLEIQQISLMLSSDYLNWAIPELIRGDFLDEHTKDYDILPYRFWYGKSDQIISFAKNLPQTIFRCELNNQFLRAVIENSDYLYKARLLQYQSIGNHKLLPGKYSYFRGEIEVVP